MKKLRRGLALVICLSLPMYACAEMQSQTADSLHASEQEASELMKIDHRLFDLGYRDSAVTGIQDDDMTRALRNFQTANGLQVTGKPDEATVELLFSDEALSEHDYLFAISAAYNDLPALQLGSTGDDVALLQQSLREYGYFEGEPGGIYGESTVNAVYRFQIANGLPETGIADGSTRIRLMEGEPIRYDAFIESCCASVGESGTNVRRIQHRLKRMGYYTGKCVGRYGSGTRQAVLMFQSLNALSPTGEADAQTCRLLFSAAASTFTDTYTIVRGSDSDDAVAICALLKSLGYPSGDTFDLNTEIGVLEFQIANGLDVTGAVDPATYSLLASLDAVSFDSIDRSADAVAVDADTQNKMFAAAMTTVGQMTQLRDSFAYVQYIALKCGVALFERDQLRFVELKAGAQPEKGAIVLRDDGRTYGIATEDGGIITPNVEGCIVIEYPETEDENACFVWETVRK